MYNNVFDKELIDYLLEFFQAQNVGHLNVTSFIIENGIYKIRFENSDLVLEFFYDEETSDCEAQIRITSVLLQKQLKGVGISKKLINSLLDYCHKHGDMSLWIYDLINRSWATYLIQHGATVGYEK